MENNYLPPKAVVADITQVSGGEVSHGIVDQLRRTKPWSLFIVILIFIMTVLLVLASGMIFLGALAMTQLEQAGKMPSLFLVIGLVVSVAAVVYFLLGLFLTKFNSAIDRLVMSGKQDQLVEVLFRQKKFWMLASIVMAVTLVLTIVYYAALITIPEVREMLSSAASG
ncbi:MAG: hypothetical protein HY080_12705 [Gammaproteobacteria bacterium]|nr:hypothetical protein [Gammaproteobacteria bacterium]